MPYEFRLPDIGEGVAEGEVVRWFVREGDTVAEDGPLVSVLTDKANVEIPSPKGGRVLKIHAQEGEKVKVGAILVTIDTGASDASTRGEPPPVTATASGVRALPPSAPPGSALAPAAAEVGRVLASPYVRRLAAERGLDLAKVRGSGPAGRVLETDVTSATAGAASPSGVLAPSPARDTDRPPSGASRPAGPSAAPPVPEGAFERIPLRGIRRVIAEHMTESRRRAAHYTYVEEVDASELVHWRDRMAKHVERKGLKLSYLPFVVKAVVAGLRAFPTVNARFDDEHQELLVFKEFHIGIATASAEGLLVPVLHHADRKSLTDLAREIQELSEKARAGTLTRGEMSGGTFTITSLGALGGVLATPILNYPEVAILGVHKITRRPVYRTDGTLGPADLMNLSISLDHRVLDGIIGAQFLATVKSYLEDPHQLFAELA